MNARARCRSLAARTKLSATRSTPCSSPNARSSSSFSLRAGAETATPGQVDPLVLLQDAAVDHLERHLGRLGVGDDQLDPAVVHQHRVADAAVGREAAGRCRDALGGALDVGRS